MPIWTKLCMKAFRYKEMKIWWHNAGHMTKMATMLICGKNPSKIFISGTGRLISTKNWYVALGTPAHHSLFKWWPGVTLINFTARSNLVTYVFYGKKWKQWIFQKVLQPVTWKLVDADNLLRLWRYVSIEGQGHFFTIYFPGFVCFVR